MKKYLFLLLLLPLIATSQTKAETEDWIISKFNRWKQNITNYDLQFGAFESYTDFKTLKIDGCNLIITTNKTKSENFQNEELNIKSFVINLDKDKQRYRNFIEQYNKNDISAYPVERYSAVVGKDVNQEDWLTENTLKKLNNESP